MARKFIKTVTVSGAGDGVSHRDLIELHKEFPFIEFGIQIAREATFAQDRNGWHRFPSAGWLWKLIEMCRDRNMNFSGHICYSWVTEIFDGRWPVKEMMQIHDYFMYPKMFRRWQLNTHGDEHEVDYDKFVPFLQAFHTLGQSVIFQADDDEINEEIPNICQDIGCENVSVLFDTSHGAGIVPDEWPVCNDIQLPCGYSGGLGPDNLAEQLELISCAVPEGHTIWIDAERKLRTPDDLLFDVSKAREFCKIAQPYVIGA